MIHLPLIFYSIWFWVAGEPWFAGESLFATNQNESIRSERWSPRFRSDVFPPKSHLWLYLSNLNFRNRVEGPNLSYLVIFWGHLTFMLNLSYRTFQPHLLEVVETKILIDLIFKNWKKPYPGSGLGAKFFETK